MADSRRKTRIAEGLSAMKRGDLASAQTAFQRVLDRSRNDAEALHWLGSIAVGRGLTAEAVKYFERLARVRPRDVSALINLAKTRLASGDARGAVRASKRAIAIQRDSADALVTHADALNRLGQRDEAVALLQPRIDQQDESPEIAHSYAALAFQSGRHEEAITVARRQFESTATVEPEVRRQLGFVLGQSLDAQGRVEEAFEAFSQANTVPIAGAKFKRAKFVKEIDEQIAFFTPARIRAIRRSTNTSRVPLLVTGVARSGTTLVEQIIHAHPSGFGAGELPNIDTMATEVMWRLESSMLYPNCLMDMPASLADELAEEYLSVLHHLAPNAQRVVDKNLHGFAHLGFVWQLLPGASVIYCRRDPIANGLSCFMSALSPRLHSYASNLSDIGLVLRQCDRLMAHWQQVLDLNVHEVQYEELVSNQEETSRQLIGAVGLEWDDACLSFHNADRVVRTLSYDQVRRPIYTQALDRHVRYESFLGPLRESLAE